MLTFDDGPLAADLVHAEARDPAELLQPLGEILATLERREAPAVFYIAGPQEGANATDLAPTFGAGLARIADAGHTLGYHAYTHNPAIWANPIEPMWIAGLAMQVDLEQLIRYVDSALGEVGLRRSDVFTPLFRQPYGGYGICAGQGQLVAAARGWIYHGFRIDSVDWTGNVTAGGLLDAAPAGRLGEASADEQAEYVSNRLRDRASTLRCGQRVDVLFHVNHLTAARLDEWMDALIEGAVAGTGQVPAFLVPAGYLTTPDNAVDLSFLADVLSGPVER